MLQSVANKFSICPWPVQYQLGDEQTVTTTKLKNNPKGYSMNSQTAAFQPSFQAAQQDDSYAGDMLVTLTEYCVIFQQLSDIVLDMSLPE
jgi:hypothetical protein